MYRVIIRASSYVFCNMCSISELLALKITSIPSLLSWWELGLVMRELIFGKAGPKTLMH